MRIYSEAFFILIGIGGFLLILLTILLPISAYAAQKWAKKCHDELVKLNAKLSTQKKTLE